MAERIVVGRGRDVSVKGVVRGCLKMNGWDVNLGDVDGRDVHFGYVDGCYVDWWYVDGWNVGGWDVSVRYLNCMSCNLDVMRGLETVKIVT